MEINFIIVGLFIVVLLFTSLGIAFIILKAIRYFKLKKNKILISKKDYEFIETSISEGKDLLYILNTLKPRLKRTRLIIGYYGRLRDLKSNIVNLNNDN